MPYLTQTQATILGIPKHKWIIHHILISKDYMNLKQAKEYLHKLNYKTNLIKELDNWWSFNQNPVIEGSKYFSRKINPYVIYTFQQYN
jgi:hypothetical protein